MEKRTAATTRPGSALRELLDIVKGINSSISAVTIGNGHVVRFVFANDQYYADLGYTRQQFEAEVPNAFDVVHPEDRERIVAVVDGILQSGEPNTYDYRCFRRDGSIIYIRCNASLVHIRSIEESVLLSITLDVTEQKKVERAAARTAEHLRAVVGSIASGVTAIVLEDSGRVEPLLVTGRYYELLGYTPKQFRAEVNSPFDPISRDDIGWVLPKIKEINRTGKPGSLEFRAIRRDGREIWLRDDVSMIRFAGLEKPVQLSVFTDITQSRELSDQLKVLTETIPGGLATILIGRSNAEQASIRFLYFNDGFYRYSGYSREEFQALMDEDPLRLVFAEDIPGVYAALECFIIGDESAVCTYRSHTREGGFRWFELKGAIAERRGESLLANLVQFDVTDRKEAEENLRISEEQFRVAAATGGRSISRYDIKTGMYYHQDRDLLALGFDEVVENVPQTFIEKGNIAPDGVEAYLEFYDKIKRGESCSLDIPHRAADAQYRWCRREATVISDADGHPSQAIIVISDITEQREKEAVYIKWQQSLQEKPPASYTLLRWNLSRDSIIEAPEGSLLRYQVALGSATFGERTLDYAGGYVYPEDRELYISFVNADAMLANYYRGKRLDAIEYREVLPGNEVRWLRLTVELVEYPNSSDVCVYMMYENVDEKKRSELLAKELAESDPLTGVLNRSTFARDMNRILKEDALSRHALFMLDVDGFKLLNDTFGHAAGDQALIEMADGMRAILRQGDLLGRLGGDEFIICLKDVPYDAVIEKKARQICALVRKTFSLEVQISASIGVASYPRDGEKFETLYPKADAALYAVKGSGGDSYAFFNDGMECGEHASVKAEAVAAPVSERSKRRMLIVDDNDINRKMLANIFKDEFLIDTAGDGNMALIRLRHYGAAVSVVLLDLIMPGMDGFTVLERMQSSVELRSIPVVVVSGQDEYETNLKAIQYGASDYITKPVDPNLIRLRVRSAISKAENERLRAQNSYLLLQSGEEAKYRTVLQSTGTVVVEYDWINGLFFYDPSISEHMAGTYDGRKLWHILLSDMVADVMDVKAMQDLVHALANDRTRVSASMRAQLKTPADEKHWFRMNVFKRNNEFQLTEKLILTFNDVNEEVTAEEKLRFQAERDELTGLLNRRTFLRKAEELVAARPANTYLMSIGDVDNFKMVNDRYGHAEGDRLLRYIADKLYADVSAAGGLCGRVGSDVFATLIPNNPETLQRTMGYPKELLSRFSPDAGTTYSVGYYIIDTPSMSVDGMMDRATMAKQTVKGKYGAKVAWYDEAMRAKLLLEQEIAGAMEAALREGMFDIYIQPQYNHLTGRICGAEALVRWMHPNKGVMFFPGEFIPLFEKNGFITRLDEYVWNRAAYLLRAWLDEGNTPVPISVNVSRLDTHDPLLCQKLLSILEKHRIPIDLFRLEITESLFEEDDRRLVAVIDALHEAGFIIEMDDFGSAYSSLNVLKDVPVDILKLDMRFFAGTEQTKGRSGVILSAVMRMAQSLDIPVIAEGVESKEQADYLASIGCPIVQGYLYAAPMPSGDFERLLREAPGDGASLLRAVKNVDEKEPNIECP